MQTCKTRICPTCNVTEIPIVLNKTRVNRKSHSPCKDCSNTKAREKYRVTHPELIQIIKTDDTTLFYCSKCKEYKPCDDFYKDKSRVNKTKQGVSSYCKQCDAKKAKLEMQTVGGRYTSYKSGATERKLEWALSKEQFSELWQKPCFYCGDSISTIGVDRLDSNFGYTISNVVPCCEGCNKFKWAISYGDFINHIARLYSNIDNIKSTRYTDYGPNTVHCQRCGFEFKEHDVQCKGNFNSMKAFLKSECHVPSRKYFAYRSDAWKRNMKFELTKPEFLSLWRKPCSYCLSSIDTIGIDRLDSSIGYTLSNLVSCCTACNQSKLHFDIATFVGRIDKIYHHIKLKL